MSGSPSPSVDSIAQLCAVSQRRSERRRRRRERRNALITGVILFVMMVASLVVYDWRDNGNAQAAPTVPAASAVKAPAPVPTPAAPKVAGVPYGRLIVAAAARHALEPALLAGLVKQESGFQRTIASHAGARGLTQLMPDTAAYVGVTDPTDPVQALNGGAKYLREQLDRFGTVRLALAAYNAGPGAVQQHGGIPPYPETQSYVRNIIVNRAAFRAAGFGR